MQLKQLVNWKLGCLAVLGLGLVACGDDDGDPAGDGMVTVLLESEDTITEGLRPGTEGENIQDGWDVTFDRYLGIVGDVDVTFSTDETVGAEAADVFAVDLTQVPATGLALWTFASLREGRWEFGYATPGAADGAMRDTTVEQADFDMMVANDWTYFVDGVMMQTGGQSCPPAALAMPGSATPNGNMSGTNECYAAEMIRFTFGASAETTFGPCEIDEMPGFAVAAGGETTVSATIHGDHLFFNGFPEGDEGGVSRLAQWLADSDLNLDGTVTQAELEQIAPAQLPEIDDRYQLGGSPITPINNMYDYVTSQFKTQGHFQGEGECPVDGVAHHDDE